MSHVMLKGRSNAASVKAVSICVVSIVLIEEGPNAVQSHHATISV